jgi:biopolymer transport protein ExbD
MRIKARGVGIGAVEVDMTPMIDMTFQLVAFFMMVLNFTEIDANERIKLPTSELAKPPETALDKPLTIQLTDDGTVIFGGEEMPIPALQAPLLREKQVMNALKAGSHLNATVIIRADRDAKAGRVQEVIRLCQGAGLGFEKFALRAKQVR